MVDQGVLIVISGPSGCGKGTICKALRQKNPDLKVSVSVTTREIRAGEVPGRDYFYTTPEEFKKMVDDGELLEYAQIYSGHYYGTPKKYVKDMLLEGHDIILEIDIQGALQIKEKFDEGVFIFLIPPSMEELHRRLVERGRESPELIMERFRAAYTEINFINKYNYIVLNDKVDKAVEQIESIITAEKCRVTRNKHLIDNLLQGEIKND